MSSLRIAFFAADGLVNGDQFGSIGKGSFNLHLRKHAGDPRHDIIKSQQLLASIHQLSDGTAFADKLQQLRREQRDGFDIIEFKAACESFLSQKTGIVQHQLFNFPWAKMHPYILPRILRMNDPMKPSKGQGPRRNINHADAPPADTDDASYT